MGSPKVSIVIPAYNAEAHLRECLESVINLSYPDFECIVVNDGSTDETPKIASLFSMRDERFRVINTENQGVSAARNTGIADAKGEWVTLMDADDCLTPKSLDFMLHAAETSGADIVIGDWRRNMPAQFPSSSQEITVKSPEDVIADTLYTHESEVGPWAKLFRREVIAAEKFRPGIRYEDIDWFYRVYEHANKIAIIPDVVYFFRDNPNSFLNHFSPEHFDLLRVAERIESHYDAKGITQLQRAARDRRLSACFSVYAKLMVKTANNDYNVEKRQCWDLICRYRGEALRNPKVAFYKKMGLLVSYLGKGATIACSRLML